MKFSPRYNGRFLIFGCLNLVLFVSVATDAFSKERRRFLFRDRSEPRLFLFHGARSQPSRAPAEENFEVRRAIAVDEERPHAVSAPNEQARFLAGYSGGGRSYSALRATDYWRDHAFQMDARWKRAGSRLSKIRSWRSRSVAGIAAGRNSVFYPFGGPDFLYADAFFPTARNYFLCGLEPVGTIPNLNAMGDAELKYALEGLQVSIASSLDYSYFITKDLRRDLGRTRLRGVVPILFVYLARTGHTIHSVDYVNLGSGGRILATSSNGNGVRIRCSSRSGGSKTVYYFRADLSNSGSGRFHQLMAANRPGVTFVKSASYLMHGSNFSATRNAIQNYSDAILQDPSGIPYRYLKQKAGWRIRLYGNYEGTLEMFKNHYQPDLRAAYDQFGGSNLSFGVGYKFDPRSSSLILATRGP